MDTLQENYHELRSQYKELLEKRLEVRKMEDLCKSKISKLQERVQTVQSASQGSQLGEDIREGLLEMSTTFPMAPNTILLRLILGDVSVIFPSKEDKVTYKQKYEQFKMLNVVCLFLLSVISLIFNENVLFNSLLHFMSVWYYFTVTLRELILVSNGSRIKWWWLVHHYCSILIAALLITWPPGECYQSFKNQFLWFSCLLSFVMLLQFRYQRAKIYRQVAMGKKHHLSVSQDLKLSNMTILLGCLLFVYIFQVYNGYTLLKLWLWSPSMGCNHHQVLLLGVLFIVVACMNASTLFTFVIGKKSSEKTGLERHKSF